MPGQSGGNAAVGTARDGAGKRGNVTLGATGAADGDVGGNAAVGTVACHGSSVVTAFATSALRSRQGSRISKSSASFQGSRLSSLGAFGSCQGSWLSSAGAGSVRFHGSTRSRGGCASPCTATLSAAAESAHALLPIATRNIACAVAGRKRTQLCRYWDCWRRNSAKSAVTCSGCSTVEV